jgi:hypothetical protein
MLKSLPRLPFASSPVRQVPAPRDVLALATLPRVDYHDAFLAPAGPHAGRTGEQWARAVLEDTPLAVRTALASGWAVLGLRLGSTQDPRLVLGWEIRRSSPDFALLGAGSRLGLRGEVLFKRADDALLFATFVQLDHAGARAVWAGTAPGHRQVVRYLLEQATT